jgi:hypothetical protein
MNLANQIKFISTVLLGVCTLGVNLPVQAQQVLTNATQRAIPLDMQRACVDLFADGKTDNGMTFRGGWHSPAAPSGRNHYRCKYNYSRGYSTSLGGAARVGGEGNVGFGKINGEAEVNGSRTDSNNEMLIGERTNFSWGGLCQTQQGTSMAKPIRGYMYCIHSK